MNFLVVSLALLSLTTAYAKPSYEPAVLKATTGRATRPDPKTLKLQFKNGKTKNYVSRLADDDTAVTYVAQKFDAKSDTLLLEASLYEGGHFVLVNLSTGHELITSGEPVWSPDRDYFAVAYDGGDAQYTPDEVSIWGCPLPTRDCKKIWNSPKNPDANSVIESAFAGENANWVSKNKVKLDVVRNEKKQSTICECTASACKCAPELKP